MFGELNEPVGGGVTRVVPPNGPSEGVCPGVTGDKLPEDKEPCCKGPNAPVAPGPVVWWHPHAKTTKADNDNSVKQLLRMSEQSVGRKLKCGPSRSRKSVPAFNQEISLDLQGDIASFNKTWEINERPNWFPTPKNGYSKCTICDEETGDTGERSKERPVISEFLTHTVGKVVLMARNVHTMHRLIFSVAICAGFTDPLATMALAQPPATTPGPASANVAQRSDGNPELRKLQLPPGQAESVATRLGLEYRDMPSVQISFDPRASQLIVMAPMVMHQTIADQVESLLEADRRVAGSQSDAGVFTYLLRNLNWQQFETEFQKLSLAPASVTSSRAGQLAVFRLTTAPLMGSTVEVNRKSGTVRISSSPAKTDGWRKLIAALDVPAAASEERRACPDSTCHSIVGQSGKKEAKQHSGQRPGETAISHRCVPTRC